VQLKKINSCRMKCNIGRRDKWQGQIMKIAPQQILMKYYYRRIVGGFQLPINI